MSNNILLKIFVKLSWVKPLYSCSSKPSQDPTANMFLCQIYRLRVRNRRLIQNWSNASCKRSLTFVKLPSIQASKIRLRWTEYIVSPPRGFTLWVLLSPVYNLASSSKLTIWTRLSYYNFTIATRNLGFELRCFSRAPPPLRRNTCCLVRSTSVEY